MNTHNPSCANRLEVVDLSFPCFLFFEYPFFKKISKLWSDYNAQD